MRYRDEMEEKKKKQIKIVGGGQLKSMLYLSRGKAEERMLKEMSNWNPERDEQKSKRRK